MVMNSNQSNIKSTEQVVDQLWRNSNSILYFEVSDNNVVQKNNKSLTINLSSSEPTTSKFSYCIINIFHHLIIPCCLQ